jgi:D-alanyl-D-alanine carboxypeptidase
MLHRDDVNAVREKLRSLVADGLPGAFAYVEDADGSGTFETDGYADPVNQVPMTPDSIYRIGSTTKTFTAVVVLQAIAEGALRLDSLIQEVLPDQRIPNGDRLTVEHLLRMRSGLFDFEEAPPLKGDLEAHLVPTSLATVNRMALEGPPSFAPGERFEYCNSNYTLLEAVVERTTGSGLGAQFRDRIFEPLGLERTSYPDEPDLSLPEPYVRGFDWSGDGWRECSEVFFGRGDGAILSTARDVGRFFRALLVEGSLVPADTLEAMMTVPPDEPAASMAYGMGLIRDDLPCGPVWGHSGGGYGYAHTPFLRLDTGRFAIVMRNASFGFHGDLDEAMAKRFAFGPDLRSSIYC